MSSALKGEDTEVDTRSDAPDGMVASGEFPAGVRGSDAPNANKGSTAAAALPLGARPGDPSLPPRVRSASPVSRVEVHKSPSASDTNVSFPKALDPNVAHPAVTHDREGLPRGIQQSVVAPLPAPPAREQPVEHQTFAESDDERTVADAPLARKSEPGMRARKKRPAPPPPMASTKSRARRTMVGMPGREPMRRLDAHRPVWAEDTVASEPPVDGEFENEQDTKPSLPPKSNHPQSLSTPAPDPGLTEQAFAEQAFTDPPISDQLFVETLVRPTRSWKLWLVTALVVGVLCAVLFAIWLLRSNADAPASKTDVNRASEFSSAPKQQEPAEEPVKEPEPAEEPVKDPAPAEEPVKDPAPAEEPVKDPEPAEEPVRDPARHQGEAHKTEQTEYGPIPQLTGSGIAPEFRHLGFIKRRQMAGMHLRKGIRLQKRRKDSAAKWHFERAVDLYPHQGAAMRNLARQAMDDGDLPLAASWAYRSTEADPRHHLSWMLLGEVQERRNIFRGAANAYRKVLAIHPRHRTARDKVRQLSARVKRANKRVRKKRRARARRARSRNAR